MKPSDELLQALFEETQDQAPGASATAVMNAIQPFVSAYFKAAYHLQRSGAAMRSLSDSRRRTYYTFYEAMLTKSEPLAQGRFHTYAKFAVSTTVTPIDGLDGCNVAMLDAVSEAFPTATVSGDPCDKALAGLRVALSRVGSVSTTYPIDTERSVVLHVFNDEDAAEAARLAREEETAGMRMGKQGPILNLVRKKPD